MGLNVRIYIISHKEMNFPTRRGYFPLLVGAKGNNVFFNKNELRDDKGDHISEKNKNFCELTGVYWIWKNVSADIVGICHYRRYFTKAVFSVRSKFFLGYEDIVHIMQQYDVIVPPKHYYEDCVIKSVKIAPNQRDMEELEKAIEHVCPEYIDSYIEFISNNFSYLYNMCIMKKDLFDKYCEWLFEILFFIEKDYDISKEDDYRARLFGFLSERLLGVWMMKNHDKIRIKEVRVVKTGESALRAKAHDIKNIYRNLKWKLRV